VADEVVSFDCGRGLGGGMGVKDPGGGGVSGDGRGRGRDARGEGPWVLCRGAAVAGRRESTGKAAPWQRCMPSLWGL
jgi:hypothetical protein